MTSARKTIPLCLLLLLALLCADLRPLRAAEAGGIRFDPPSGWTDTPKPMRTANYTIPATGGDSQDGEMAVFYFGPGQGGGVEANVRRWLGQFVKADGSPMSSSDASRSERVVNGIQVTLLDVQGTYLFKPFPMARRATPMPGYRMLAAIAQGPDAPVFFKLTAPSKTAASAEPGFRKLIDSLSR